MTIYLLRLTPSFVTDLRVYISMLGSLLWSQTTWMVYREVMASSQSITLATLSRSVPSPATAAASSRIKVLRRYESYVKPPVVIAVIVGILAILTLLVCLWFCVWLRHRNGNASHATPPSSPGTWNSNFSPLDHLASNHRSSESSERLRHKRQHPELAV